MHVPENFSEIFRRMKRSLEWHSTMASSWLLLLAKDSEDAWNLCKNSVATVFLGMWNSDWHKYLLANIFDLTRLVICLGQTGPHATCMHVASLRPTHKRLGARQAASHCANEVSWGKVIAAGQVAAATFVVRARASARTII